MASPKLAPVSILLFLKFKVVSSSKDALIVTNKYGRSEHYEVFW